MAQSSDSPDRWAKADPETVLTDPAFYKLTVEERESVLKGIDPKFAKMSYGKQDTYLWQAETANLPKAAPPKHVFTWDPHNSGSTGAESTKIIEGAGIRVEASVHRQEFFSIHVRVTNQTKASLTVVPQTFLLSVVAPKPQELSFVYASRGAHELVWTEQRHSMLDDGGLQAAPGGGIKGSGSIALPKDNGNSGRSQGLLDRATAIVSNYLPERSVDPAATVEGNVYFKSDRKARAVTLRVFAGEYAFDIPFEIAKH